ncbi:MAG: methyltransferase domain-containing protein, partial [bacterium]|nr:methyltransferase domain-containing protein [bacterium]
KQVFGKSELLDAGKILGEVLGLSTGKIVADLGAGGGMFSLQSARLVGAPGQVYAVDILKTVLSDIDSKARMSGLHNIKTIWSNLEVVGAAKINDGLLDFALAVNVLFQSKKHYEIMAEASRLLKSGGKLLIIDWSNSNSGLTPSSDRRVNPDKMTEICSQLGLILEQQFRAGQYHFGMIFRKQ